MADDHRYDWLDNDAVERLLRGEPVETDRGVKDQDEQARIRAERLAASLGSIAGPAEPADGPLPGEEAALAAFRAARASAPARGAARAVELPVVRPRGARFGRPSRLHRPLRAGMVAVLAGCAFGGMAVAAGAGVLGFGPTVGEPRPTSSVSAAETRQNQPAGTGLTPGPHRNASHSPGGSRGTASGDLGGDPDPTATTSEGDPSEDGEEETGSPDGLPSTEPPSNGDARKRWVRVACRQYLDGEAPEIDPDRMRRLERVAGGPTAVRRYCERILTNPGKGHPEDGDSGGGSGGDSGGEGGTGGGSGGGSGGGKGGDDGDSAGETTSPSPPPPTPG
ncbi:hypothetical protein, partial [Streptomyces palmae]